MAGGLSRNTANIQFQDGKEQNTSLNELVILGGASPQPHLRSQDYVLCCVRMPHGQHNSMYGVSDFFIPAQVQVQNDIIFLSILLYTDYVYTVYRWFQ